MSQKFDPKIEAQLVAENEDLRIRLDEAEEILRAIRSGEVDALIVSGEGGEQIYTLQQAEDALAESEEKFRGLVEGLPSVVYRTAVGDANTTLYVSPQITTQLGYTPAEWMADPGLLSETIHPDDRENTLKQIADKGLSNKQFDLEYRRIARGGRLVWVHDQSLLLNDMEGKPKFRQGIMLDISARKEAELKLELAVARLTEAQEIGSLGSFNFDLSSNHIETSPQLDKILGFSPGQERTPSALIELLHPEDRKAVEFAVAACIERGIPYDLEYRIIRRSDGQTRWLRGIGKAGLDSTGKIVRYSGVNMDIHERKQADEARHASEEHYRLLFENSGEAILDGKPDGTIQAANPEACRIFGLSEDEIKKRGGAGIVDMNDPRLKIVLEERRTTGRYKGELNLLRQDGTIFPSEISITEIIDAHGNQRSTIIIRDITERKQAETELLEHRDHLERLVKERTAELVIAREQAEAANRAKGDFLAVMSHEIRTPLNGVLGMAHLIMQTELTEQQRSYLANLKISGETLMTTINDILDYSKIESGKLTLEAVNFDLEDVLRNLSSNAAYRTYEKGLELVFNTGPDVPNLLVGDPSRISQVLLNLVGNAIKFTHAGDLVVRTRLIGLQADSARLEFSVKDTGIGMTAEQMARLFKPFSQADSSTSRKYGGSGLGLSISQQLVHLMGGELRVESQFGQGSVFTFTLDLGRQAAPQSEPVENIPDLAGRHILVVDDNPETLDAIRSTLESFACRVTVAKSAETGLALLAAPIPDAPYELVFMDWKMPGGMDGLEAIRRMKQDPRLKQIPAVLMASAEELLTKKENSELDGTLIKPLNRSQLFNAVIQALGKPNSFKTKPVTAQPVSEDLEKLKGAQILLVEDNHINQIVAQEMLKRMGLQVSIANNGEEALEFVELMQFDAVLMDVHMPGMDGYQVTAQIRRDARFAYDRLPVIAMTADAMSGDREKALQAGMNDYVSKPVDMMALKRTLLHWVKRGAELAA